jgi:hypothetical protein
MKLLIDTNVFHKIFDAAHAEFDNFAGVNKCLLHCKGTMVVGGTRFQKELKPYYNKYGKLLVELQKKTKLQVLDREVVDKEELRIKQLEADSDFDDPHIIACAILGRVEVVCTDDKRADKFILDKKFYPKQFRKPKIYRYKSHEPLLNKCFP